ncbi:MAG TPA: hypothetical protein VLV86_00825 [Vicinamibacterales bacterium]|nr:hypothetical protein [Vicinamibacterales bacterium]
MTPSPYFHFEYDAVHKVFAVRMHGAITDAIFKECYAATPRHVEGHDVRAALMDLGGVERYDVSAAAVRDVSRLPPLFPDPTPRWVVAPQDYVFGMARMFQMTSHSGRDELHVVRAMGEALAALGITAPQFERVADRP